MSRGVSLVHTTLAMRLGSSCCFFFFAGSFLHQTSQKKEHAGDWRETHGTGDQRKNSLLCTDSRLAYLVLRRLVPVRYQSVLLPVAQTVPTGTVRKLANLA